MEILDQNILTHFKAMLDQRGFATLHLITRIEGGFKTDFENFSIKIEKYFQELYPTLISFETSSLEINLFNLIDYLDAGQSDYKSNFFRKEIDLQECYRKQLTNIASAIKSKYDKISDFFETSSVNENFEKFEFYWKTKHPELYKKS